MSYIDRIVERAKWKDETPMVWSPRKRRKDREWSPRSTSFQEWRQAQREKARKARRKTAS